MHTILLTRQIHTQDPDSGVVKLKYRSDSLETLDNNQISLCISMYFSAILKIRSFSTPAAKTKSKTKQKKVSKSTGVLTSVVLPIWFEPIDKYVNLLLLTSPKEGDINLTLKKKL